MTSPPITQNLPEWVIEAPEEIDVLLAQREFVEAQKLLLKAERVIRQESAQSDINRQLNEKRKNLIEILSNELCPAADRSLRAGARGQRLPAKLLIELGQERKAAKLFLKSRSEAQRYSQKSIRIGNDYQRSHYTILPEGIQNKKFACGKDFHMHKNSRIRLIFMHLTCYMSHAASPISKIREFFVIVRKEGNLLLYSTKFSRSFFDHLRETAKEFNHDFESKPVNFSALGEFYKKNLSFFPRKLSL